MLVIRYATQDIHAAFASGEISGVFRAEDWRENETAREGHAHLEIDDPGWKLRNSLMEDPGRYVVRVENDEPGLYEREVSSGQG